MLCLCAACNAYKKFWLVWVTEESLEVQAHVLSCSRAVTGGEGREGAGGAREAQAVQAEDQGPAAH